MDLIAMQDYSEEDGGMMDPLGAENAHAMNGFGGQFDEERAMLPTTSVHQCSICNKLFVSYKGLQQHHVLHTDERPYQCNICEKAFKFKSNLFEHMSLHGDFNPHTCPFCGKTCRLKGNLKKHMKVHFETREQLEEAWSPLSSKRRPATEIPDNAIIVRSSGDPHLNPPYRCKKRKLSLGPDPSAWIEKLRKGVLLPSTTVEHKMRRLEEAVKEMEATGPMTVADMMETSRAISFERFDCPLCKSMFISRMECMEHLEEEHPHARLERPMFCETCLKTFADRRSLDQHESYHKRVELMVTRGEIEMEDPDILLPLTSYYVAENNDM